MCARVHCAMVLMWKSEDSLQESVPPSITRVSGVAFRVCTLVADTVT